MASTKSIIEKTLYNFIMEEWDIEVRWALSGTFSFGKLLKCTTNNQKIEYFLDGNSFVWSGVTKIIGYPLSQSAIIYVKEKQYGCIINCSIFISS